MGRYLDKKHITWLLRCVLIAVIVFLQWIQLEASPGDVKEWSFMLSGKRILMNLSWIVFVNLILVLVLQKWEISLGIMSAVCGIWSVAGYYVTMYHGSPLCFTMLRNIGTAMNVAGGYEYPITAYVAALLGLSVVQVALLVVLSRIKTAPGFSWKRVGLRLAVLTMNGLLMYVSMFDATPLKPLKSIGWDWKEPMNTYGYTCCLAEDLGNLVNPFTAPEGYDSKAIEWEASEEAVPEVLPDVILILNETFYDLTRYSDIQPDRDIFEEFYGLENAVTGHAVTPVTGGGTNNAEYELLTSNSMYLLNADAPFHYVDFEPENSNVVRYFNDLGYETFGMHCEVPTNYARNRVYPQLGFDHVLLGREEFQYIGHYGNRVWLDSDNYRDLLDQYEAADDAPRFLYLLTYQNHGGFTQNDASMDTVHAATAPEELSGQVDEYLSSVDLSIQAFLDLTEYFKTVDRPVIICMVGDHGPSFITELEPRDEYSDMEAAVVAKATPYVIWANFPLEEPSGGDASMVDMVPMLLRQAGLPLTSYYETILALHEELPIRTSDNITVSRDGIWEAETYGGPRATLLMQYYYMEYNGLVAGSDFIAELFECPSAQ